MLYCEKWDMSMHFEEFRQVFNIITECTLFFAKSQEEMSLYSTGSGILETEIVRIADGSCIK